MGEFIGVAPPEGGFVQTPKFNFGHYSQGARYQEVNGNLIARVLGRLPQTDILAIDVCTGFGMVPRLAGALLAGVNKRLHIYGVDLDQYAITQARTQITDTANTVCEFIHGNAARLEEVLKDKVQPGRVRWTSIHDAIHEIRNDEVKKEIVANQAEMLAPGGLLSYNSAFTTEAVGREWAYWQMKFMELLGARKYRGEDIQRLPVHPPSFYSGLITAPGLIPIHEQLVNVPQGQEELEAISEYPPFVQGFTSMMVFPREVTLEEAVEGMKAAIPAVFDRFKTKSLSRIWHEMIAQKPITSVLPL